MLLLIINLLQKHMCIYFIKRVFSVAVPTIWNQLPITITFSQINATFKKKINTYLFEIAFPPIIVGDSLHY